MNEDVIAFLEQKAGLAGEFAGVDERYVECFLSLTPEASDRLAMMVMLGEADEVLALAGGECTEHVVQNVAAYVLALINSIGIGLLQFDELGRFRVVSRVGLRPEEDYTDVIEAKLQAMKPCITHAVRRLLPVLQSQPPMQEDPPE